MAKTIQLFRGTHHLEEHAYLHDNYRDQATKTKLNGKSYLASHFLLKKPEGFPLDVNSPEWDNLCAAERRQSASDFEKTLGASKFFKALVHHFSKFTHYRAAGPLTNDVFIATTNKPKVAARYALSQPIGRVFAFDAKQSGLLRISRLPFYKRAFKNANDGNVHLAYLVEEVKNVQEVTNA